MFDKDFIKRKTKLIHEDIRKLEDLSEYSFDDLAKDAIRFSAVERFLEKIIMRAIDINQHLIAELGQGYESVKSYEDTFYRLADLKVYDEEFAKTIAPSAGLRNRLVHEYNDTNPKIIYQSVGDAIKQYAQYCKYILDFLGKQK